MKKPYFLSLVLFLLSLYFLISCNSGNRADIERLLSPAALPYLKQSKLIQVSSHDTSGGNEDHIIIPAGKRVTILNVEGPGMITRMWFKVDSPDPYFLRRIVIRIYWDEETKPSVEVPFGDFFGNGFKYQSYISQYLGMTSGGYICYFPMPFEQNARIEISNETNLDIYSFSYQIDYQKFEGALDREVGYFHAFWNRNIRTNYDSNYILLQTTGKGHIVGVNLNMQSYSGNLAFLEGDEMIYVDGEKKPAIYGTGTEDYFSGGWSFNQGEFAGPYNGLIYKDDSMGRIAAYRLYILDPIPFRKSIKFTIEHGHGNQEVADYSSTVYWYQIEPHKSFPAFKKAGQRIPLRIVKPSRFLEAENLKFELGGLKSKISDMSDYGPDWSNNKQLLISAHNSSSFKLILNGLKEPVYNLTLFYTKGPSYGNAEVFINNEKAGEIRGYSPYLLPDGKIMVNKLKNQGQVLDIKFIITGKEKNAQGYDIGLDGFSLDPERIFIPEWNILGPFPNLKKQNGERSGLDSIFPVEQESFDTNRVFPGVNGKPIRWKYVKTPEDGYISFLGKISPHESVVAYAVTFFYAASAAQVNLFIGSDDGIKVFFNGLQVHRYLGNRMAEPDQAELLLNIKPGWNKLLLKIENNYGGFGFYARILDRQNKIMTSAFQKPIIN